MSEARTVHGNHRRDQLHHPRRSFWTFLLLVTHAILFALAFPPTNLWPLIFLAPVPLAMLAMRDEPARPMLLAVLVVHWLLWMWLGRWLVQVTVPGYPLYALGMAAFGVLTVALLRGVHRHPRLGCIPAIITVPVIITGVEVFRGEVAFDGYPWFLHAHPLIEARSLAQSADLFGTYFISFLVALAAGAIVDTIRRTPRGWRAVAPFAAAAIIIWAGNIAYGSWRIGQTDTHLRPGPRLVVIQTNLPQDNKMRWTIEEQVRDVDAFIDLTVEAWQAATAEGPVHGILWPETMLPGYGFTTETLATLRDLQFELEGMPNIPGDYFARNMRDLAAIFETPLLIGSPTATHLRLVDHQWRWRRYYNSAYLIEPGQPPAREPQRYDKIFLTPFGETMPYISAWPWLQQQLLAIGARGMQFDLDAGESAHTLALPVDDEQVHIATPICFEVTMARVVRRLVRPVDDEARRRADIIVNLTNDGWFGWHDPGRVQHAQISRFRSIEHRIPMLRAANTGLSMSIDSTGKVIEVIGDGRYGAPRQAGWLAARPSLDGRRTLYGTIGDVWGWLSLMLTATAAAWMIPALRRKG